MRSVPIPWELPFKHDMLLPFLLYMQLPFKSDTPVVYVIVTGVRPTNVQSLYNACPICRAAERIKLPIAHRSSHLNKIVE